MCKVSIIVPIYNKESYLEQCLISIKNQTEQSYEVLMIDDGSKDGSAQIAQSFLKDKRFKYIYQENAGVSVARNIGIKNAHGDWICFIDSDDKVKEDFLDILLSNIDDTDIDIISCCCQCSENEEAKCVNFYNEDRLFADDDISLGMCNKDELYLELMDTQYNSDKFRRTAIGVPWGKLYKGTFIKTNELLFNPCLVRMQDNIFNMYAFDKAKKIKYINQPLYIYNTEHIEGYGRKYHSKANIFFNEVCQERYKFMKNKRFFNNDKMKFTFYSEVATLTDTMLTKFYLNKDNQMSLKKRLNDMEKRFGEEPYFSMLCQKHLVIRRKERKIRLFLLRRKKYKTLFIIDAIIQCINKIRK